MRSIEQAFLDLLSGFLVGDGEAPAGGGWQGAPGTSPFTNYLIFKPGQGVTDGSLAHADANVDRDFMVTCVAATRDGCSILARNVVAAVQGRNLTTPTRRTSRPIVLERWGPVDRDDTVQPSVFMAVHVFGVHTTPV